MTVAQGRVAAGTPTGGQFSAYQRSDDAISLAHAEQVAAGRAAVAAEKVHQFANARLIATTILEQYPTAATLHLEQDESERWTVADVTDQAGERHREALVTALLELGGNIDLIPLSPPLRAVGPMEIAPDDAYGSWLNRTSTRTATVNLAAARTAQVPE